MNPRDSVVLAAVVLMIVTLTAFGRAATFDFVNWDDNLHVFANPYFVTFDYRSLRYFWFHSYQEMYIPVSYMVFGILNLLAHRPAGSQQLTVTGTPLDPHIFHCANLVLHIANVLMVFLLIRRLIRDDCSSLLGALFFAIHPLQVESVVWISELRGLLGATFTLLSIHIFLYAAENDEIKAFFRSPTYWFSIFLAILALLSKPSCVVIPFFMALIARYGLRQSIRRIAVEIAPFITLSLVIAFLTDRIQTHPPGQIIALWLRPLVACDALCFYFVKLLMPINLSIDYGRTPTWVLSQGWSWIEYLVTLAIAGAIAYGGRKKSYLCFGGLFWFFALMPVLGVTPFVFQEKSTTADRYVYFALVGVSLIISYTLISLPQRTKKIAAMVATVWLAALYVLTLRQTDVWKNSLALFTQAVAVNDNLPDMQNNLGGALRDAGDYNDSIVHLCRAVALDSRLALYHDDLGISYIEVNDTADAEAQFREAVAVQPQQFLAYYDLGLFLIRNGRGIEGTADLKRALEIDPAESAAAEQLGDYYVSQGLYSNAIQVYSNAVQISPSRESLLRKLGIALYAAGRTKDAVGALNRAITLNPSDQTAQNTLEQIAQGSFASH